jgi:hypothetical protein
MEDQVNNVISFKVQFEKRQEVLKLKHFEKERIKRECIKNYEPVQFVPYEPPSIKNAKFFCLGIYNEIFPPKRGKI